MVFSRSLVQLARQLESQVSDEQRAKAVMLIRDHLAISLASKKLSKPSEISRRAVTKGVSGGSTSWNTKHTVPPSIAAFANSAAAHSLDFDDTHDLARLHTTTVVLPATLAMAEINKASGRELLNAFIVASEIMCRLGLAAKPKGTGPSSMWFMTQLAGYFGATIGAGLVSGLSDEKLVSALGISLSQAAGAKQTAVGVGSNMRAIYPAFSSQAGVESALLATEGMIGPEESFEGVAGLWRAFFGEEMLPNIQDEILDSEKPWEFEQIVVKPWPTCRMAHPYIDAVFSMDVNPSEVEEVVIEVNASAERLCLPESARKKPTTLPDACFSIPFVTAIALVKKQIDLNNVNSDLLNDSAVLAMAEKVKSVNTLPDGPGNPAGVVTVKTSSHEYSAVGNPIPPASDELIKVKFLDCLAQSGLSESAENIWDFVGEINTLSVIEFINKIRTSLPEEFFEEH